MRDFLYRLVDRLHGEARPLSRNKHFHAFSGESRQALRIDKHLRDLEEHLELLRQAGERPRMRRISGGGVQLVLTHPSLQVVRTATLTAEEVELLRRHPAGAWALETESGQAGAPPAAGRVRR